MAEIEWDGGKSVTVPARPENGGYWTLALEYVDGPRRLKFKVVDDQETGANKWSYAAQGQCTADGDPKAPVDLTKCLLADAAPGALIGKIGGSTAGKSDGSMAGKTDGAKVFAVGSFCVLALDEKTSGPVYLTMNVDPVSSTERTGQLSVMIYRELK